MLLLKFCNMLLIHIIWEHCFDTMYYERVRPSRSVSDHDSCIARIPVTDVKFRHFEQAENPL